jgi:crotonobetaine/carnitine-CoA ligase
MDTLKPPNRDESVLRYMLERRVREAPDETYAIFQQTGERWTHREFMEKTQAYAAGLQKLGVRQGDFVIVWLPNGPHCLLAYMSLAWLGAVYTPINTAYRGGLLEHVIHNAGATLMVADDRLVDRLASVDRGKLQTLVVVGESPPQIDGLTVLPESALTGDAATLQPLTRPIEPWDHQMVIYTSGTTGPSKGVLCSYMQQWFAVQSGPPNPGQRAMLVGPMFHLSGAGVLYSTLFHGGSFVMLEAFSTHTYWRDVREFGITTGVLLGAMATFLLKEPPSPEDRNHTLRQVMMIPLSDDAAAFTERFGVDIRTAYNMTELSTPVASAYNPKTRGTSGRLRPQLEARIVDENDFELPDGEVGEMVLRSELPWLLCSGYHNNPEATARAWRNGWFHTGDALKRVDGEYFFVDRKKDAIRRRGENISSFEVEKEILAHPAVRDCAVIPVSSEFSEDEVLAAVTLVAGASLDCVELIEFLKGRLAHFMIPRYVRVMDALPTTPTNKVEKYVLRGEGVTAETWDRDAAGVVIKRDRLATRPAAGQA